MSQCFLDLAFGDGNSVTGEGRNVSVQCISGTGSLRVGANFLAKHFPGNKTVYLPKPSWGNYSYISIYKLFFIRYLK